MLEEMEWRAVARQEMDRELAWQAAASRRSRRRYRAGVMTRSKSRDAKSNLLPPTTSKSTPQAMNWSGEPSNSNS